MVTGALSVELQNEADAFIGRNSGEPLCIEGVTEIPNRAVNDDFIKDYQTTFINNAGQGRKFYSRDLAKIGNYVSRFLSVEAARDWFEGVYKECPNPDASVLCDNFSRRPETSKSDKPTEKPVLISPRVGMFLLAVAEVRKKNPSLADDLMALAFQGNIVVVTGKQYPHPAYVDPNSPDFKKILLMDYCFEGQLGSQDTIMEDSSNSGNAGGHIQKVDVARFRNLYSVTNANGTATLSEEGKIKLLAQFLVHEHRHIGQYRGQVQLRPAFGGSKSSSNNISPFEMSAMLYLWKEDLRTMGIEAEEVSYWSITAHVEGLNNNDTVYATEKDAMNYTNCILEAKDCDKLSDSNTYLQATDA